MTVPRDAMAPVKIPANLPELVRAAFNRARASGDVNFYPTQVTLLNVNSVPIQLRFSPALANKPKAPLPPSPTIAPADADADGTATPVTKKPPTKKPFFDPFDNPPAAMVVTPLPPSHLLVLNKFAVVPEHSILVTTAFKEQTHLLDKADLDVAYGCIQAYDHYHQKQHQHKQEQEHGNGGSDERGGDPEKDGGLFVFFNSGPHSGASQPHRHLQLLPVARMKDGLEHVEGGEGWEPLVSRLADSTAAAEEEEEEEEEEEGAAGTTPSPGSLRERVPFQTFAERIRPGADLRAVYLGLYRRACEAVLGTAAAAEIPVPVDDLDGDDVGGVEAKISYNLAMTRDVMVVAPRVAEGEVVSARAEDGGGRRVLGKLALNGTVLAGMALVKTQAEWDALRAEPEQLLTILGRIGIPVPSVQSPSLLMDEDPVLWH